jgi:hypothetical protein
LRFCSVTESNGIANQQQAVPWQNLCVVCTALLLVAAVNLG